MPGEKKKEVLDLLGGKKKKKAPVAVVTPSPEKTAPPKKEALDLLTPRRRKREQPAPAVADPVVAESPAPVSSSVAKEESRLEQSVEKETPVVAQKTAEAAIPQAQPVGSTINVKVPVPVADLAALMGLKPFKLLGELVRMGVFANPATLLDSDQVAALCEKHGFVYERVRREKGAGVKAPTEELREPEAIAPESEPDDVLKARTPIITVMGHMDTERRPFSIISAAPRWWQAKQEALPSISAPTPYSTATIRLLSLIRRGTRFSPRCAPAGRM